MLRIGLFLWIIMALPGLAQETPGRITVNGFGEVTAAPDMATLSMGVTQEADTAQMALARTSQVTAAILARLEAAGIAKWDMQTSSLTLNPRYTSYSNSDAPPKIVGFVASNMITVRSRNLDDLGALLDAVAREGANEFRGLTFGTQTPEPLENEARVAAVKDAMARAALYAETAGVTLGRIISISENGGMRPDMAMGGMAFAREAAVPIAAGEITLTAQITMVYEIAPAPE